jgi:hypothetical protein
MKFASARSRSQAGCFFLSIRSQSGERSTNVIKGNMTILNKAFAAARELNHGEIDQVGAGSGYQVQCPYSYSYQTEDASGHSVTTTVSGTMSDSYVTD